MTVYSSTWENVLQILKLDSRINKVLYNTFIMKLEVISESNNILILACPNEYTRNLIKSSELIVSIKEAVNAVSDSGEFIVEYVLKNDKESIAATTIGTNKVKERQGEDFVNSSGLSREFTFENFVIGDCNRFAQANAFYVSNHPGSKERNPLYLWGNAGNGKTHLAHAIGNNIVKNFPNKSVLFTTCEKFTNAYVACMKNSSYETFRNKYRNVDVLIIDDIQFLIGKEGTQLEFFNTFEELVTNGKQIIITSDKSPNNLVNLDERIISRFKQGILMDIQPPDFETRKSVLTKKVTADNLHLDDEIINYICENVTKNIRELNGAYNTISSYCALNSEITLELAQQVLAPIISPNSKKNITTGIIMDAVSKYYAVSIEQMLSKNRRKECLIARNVAMYLTSELIDMTQTKIGQEFGSRTHSTVINSIENVKNDENLLMDADNIKKRILE